ncbi:MAG: hypothetical protein JNJ46_23185 [Myxococcales bacterium]|nr:hypothetical protein [Myxococcales bacterium]
MTALSPVEAHYHRLLSQQLHTCTPDRALAALGFSEGGLSAEEIRQRVVRYGRHELPHAQPPGLLIVLFRQFRSLLSWASGGI